MPENETEWAAPNEELIEKGLKFLLKLFFAEITFNFFWNNF